MTRQVASFRCAYTCTGHSECICVFADCHALCNACSATYCDCMESAWLPWLACLVAQTMLMLKPLSRPPVARQANFEAIFASFDKGNKGGLTLQEMYQFTQATRLVRMCHLGSGFGVGTTVFRGLASKECAYCRACGALCPAVRQESISDSTV